MTLHIFEIPCLRDNYAFLVHAEGSSDAIVIDPSETEPVQRALSEHGLKLRAILNTHHHWDHVGGNEALAAAWGSPDSALPVYAHRSDRGRVACQTHDVDDGVAFEVIGLEVRPLHIPGHTLGAVAYCIEDMVFTGDTLFVAGCGRLFEGTPAQMHDSLNNKLAALDPATRVFAAHEYTVSNLRFALHAEPDNQAVRDKLAWAEGRRANNLPTIPSTIAEEKATNPFMRVDNAALAARYAGAGPAEVLGAIRAAKNQF